MKLPSEELFQLIKSLTAGEKTFLKGYYFNKSNKKQVPEYILLFDAIVRMNVFEKKTFFNTINKSGFSKNIKRAKEHITELIINGLNEYYRTTNPRHEIKHLIVSAEILLNKNLTQLAEKKLKKALQQAENYNYTEIKSEVIQLLAGNYRNQNNWEALNRLYEKRGKYYENLRRNQVAFDLLFNQIEVSKAVFYEKPVKKNKLKTLLNKSRRFFIENKKYFTIRDFISYYRINTFLYMGLGDPQKAHNESVNLLFHLEKNKELIIGFHNLFAGALTNLIAISDTKQNSTKDEKEIELYLTKAVRIFEFIPGKQISTYTKDILLMVFINYITIKNNSGEVSEAIAFYKKIPYKLFSKDTSRAIQYALIYSHSCSLFIAGNYKMALKEIVNLIHSHKQVHEPIYAPINILYILCHAELNNFEILPNILRSTRKVLEKLNLYGKFEQTIVDFYLNDYNKFNKKNTREAYIQLKNKIEYSTSNKQFSVHSKEYLFLTLWLDSKIRKVSFAVAAVERSLQK